MRVKDILNKNLFSSINSTFKTYATAHASEVSPEVASKLSNYSLFPDPDVALLAFNSDFGGLYASDLLEEYKDNQQLLAEVFKLRNYRNWLRYVELDMITYNPLYNVESHEEFKTTTNYGKTATGNNSLTGSQTSNVGSREMTNQQYGYNDNTPQNDSKNITAATTDTVATTTGTTTSEVLGGTDIVTEVRDRGGNIGVTKSTELFMDQAAVLASWGLIDRIFRDIKKELSYPIYE